MLSDAYIASGLHLEDPTLVSIGVSRFSIPPTLVPHQLGKVLWERLCTCRLLYLRRTAANHRP
ncbi:hypothetical protein GGQ07_003136 [Salinibacter ruber]|uniref:Uncharacterized protein n=1 Tax=Salinibacter ruber TaxID=146919 RepID=A0A9X2UBH4_9BACT|nr:hypothetical protein [Salinibacter ruber]MCS3953318.1 hypothetical protein [Salinibacter ruber]MCS4116165.1 hypothetical protein [Salinibacter ruber]MCS4181676.1 hypothetical protein [Salinibacter ruber]